MPRHSHPLAASRPFAHTPRAALVLALRAPQQKGGRQRC